MRKLTTFIVAACVALAGAWFFQGRGAGVAGDKNEPMLAHMVYFSLKDNCAAAKDKLVEACKKYLTKHPGEVFFGAGVLAADLKRPVNDIDWDVALHIVFQNKAAHDRYQDAPRHEEFIKENRDNWKKVRVFDSVLIK
jgi:hypothetical protein